MENDNVLLKIHRLYSKDEAIAYLFKKMQEKDIEYGKLKSEFDEYRYNEQKREGKILLRGKQIESENKTLKTKMMLIKRYFKVKFNQAYGLHIVPKKQKLNNV